MRLGLCYPYAVRGPRVEGGVGGVGFYGRSGGIGHRGDVSKACGVGRIARAAARARPALGSLACGQSGSTARDDGGTSEVGAFDGLDELVRMLGVLLRRRLYCPVVVVRAVQHGDARGEAGATAPIQASVDSTGERKAGRAGQAGEGPAHEELPGDVEWPVIATIRPPGGSIW